MFTSNAKPEKGRSPWLFTRPLLLPQCIDKLTNKDDQTTMATNSHSSPRYHLTGQPDGIIITDTHQSTWQPMRCERSTTDDEVYTRLLNGEEVVDWIHDSDDRYTIVAPLYHFLTTLTAEDTVIVDHQIDALLYHDNEYTPPENPVYTVQEMFELLEEMCFDFWNEYGRREAEAAR